MGYLQMIDMEKEHNGPVFLREIEIRYKKNRTPKETVNTLITCPSDVVKLFYDLQDEAKEKLITINLDNKNKILCFEVVAIGSVNSIHVRPMEVFRTAFPVNAHSAIVLHNHPSGDPTPSEEDNVFTSKLDRLALDMGLKFVDHIIIGNNRHYSFREKSDIISTML